MSMRGRHPIEGCAGLGDEIYEQQLRSKLEPAHKGGIVAIDIDTGAFELGKNSPEAAARLRARLPEAQIYCIRVGYPAVYHIGYGDRKVKT